MVPESSTAHNDMVTVLPAYVLIILGIEYKWEHFLTTLFVLLLMWQEHILTGWEDIGSSPLLREFGVSNCAIDFQSKCTNSNLSCCG